MFNNFPYTNFHNLNLDWLVKTVKLLFNKAVFSINNIEPDAEGNVTISGAELGAVGTVNNIAPVDGNVTLTASDVGAIATGQGVTKVNGISPDANGNVLSGTIRSVNGISPTSLPTPGNISITASDVGALPSTIDPVETVNGISPDANGNVNVGTVKSVNNSTPDANGNVNLPTVAGVTSVDGIGPDSSGNVQLGNVYVKTVNEVSPTNGNVQIVAKNTRLVVTSGWTVGENVVNNDTRLTKRPAIGLAVLETDFTLRAEKPQYQTILSGFDVPTTGIPIWFLVRKMDSNDCYSLAVDYLGNLIARTTMPAGTYEGSVTYSYLGEVNIPIVSET